MIDKNRLLDEFIKLASFDSESFKEIDISNYVYKTLVDLGLDVKIDNVGDILASKNNFDFKH